MTKPTRSNGERLAEVRATLPKLERERDAVMARRRECLLDDHVAGRRHCDAVLAGLKLDLQAAHDKAELLGRAGPHVVQEPRHQGWTWPTSLSDAHAALAQIQPELLRLRSIRPVDRSVAADDLINSLVKREYALLRLIESLQPKNMTAA